MCSGRPSPGLRASWLTILLLAGFAVRAESPETGAYEAFLVTYGPGEVYWQRFGHNAIWLREPSGGLDHSFNFGFFDFEQENFLLRFVQGRMLYFAAALPAQQEMDYYRNEGRSVRVQKLHLAPAEYARLRDHLLRKVRPENRDYLYDYYLDNCSTRLRDALDLALDGALAEQFRPQSALQDFRAHTRRSTVMDYWYYLGLELALGMPVDRPIDRWREMFLPEILADSLAELAVLDSHGLRSVVAEDRLVHASVVPLPESTPPEVWWRYLGLGLTLVLAGWALARFTPSVLAEALMQSWMLLAGSLGLLMVGVWLWTDHAAASPNANLLLLNPLMALALVPALRRPVAVLVALGLLGTAVFLALPQLQYTRDVAALIVPLNLASTYRLLRFEAPEPVRRIGT